LEPSRQFKTVQYPQHQQLALPGMGDSPEQMSLFRTTKFGDANVYQRNLSKDAEDWGSRAERGGKPDLEILEGESFSVPSEFFGTRFTPEPGSTERRWAAFAEGYGEEIKGEDVLGHDAYPDRANPDLKFDDLHSYQEDDGSVDYSTPEGTLVGRVQFHDDEWGSNVDYAEISPLYKGRKFSREAIKDFTENYASGVVHAGSYSDEGEKAFQAKGIPTTEDIEEALYDWTEGLVDESEFPNEGPWVMDRQREIESVRQAYAWDEDTRRDFRESLEEVQGEILRKLQPRKGSGWKPRPMKGRQMEAF
jgi:hypothetical protein